MMSTDAELKNGPTSSFQIPAQSSHHSNVQRVTAPAHPHGPALAVLSAQATLILMALAFLKSHGKKEEHIDGSTWLFQST